MRRFALLASLLLLSAAPATPILAQAAAQVETRTVGTARLENVPPIPADVQASVQRYQNYRETTFQDWLPDGSILITTRFGATNQVHRVAAPGAARVQLTFFDEPVADAEVVPGTGRFIVERDTGGDEWFQLYAMDVGADALQLTEPGTRNQQLVFSKNGRLAAWSRATKGSGDYAILVADPANAASRRVAYQGTGNISPAHSSASNTRILHQHNISNRETRLALLDLSTGRAS